MRRAHFAPHHLSGNEMSKACEHGRRRSECKECGGSSICEHGRRRHRCKECGSGGGILAPEAQRLSDECGEGVMVVEARPASMDDLDDQGAICTGGLASLVTRLVTSKVSYTRLVFKWSNTRLAIQGLRGSCTRLAKIFDYEPRKRAFTRLVYEARSQIARDCTRLRHEIARLHEI